MSTVGMDLSTIFGNGGIQRYAWELLEHLVRLEERPDLFILTRSKKIDLIRQAVGNSDRVQISGGMPHPLALGDSLRSLTNLYKGLVWKRHLRDVDLVHFHEVSIYTPAAGRHVTTVHDLFPLQEEIPVPDSMRSSWTRLAGQVVRTADRILAPSEYTRSIIGQLFPDDVHRVRVTPLAASDRFVPSELDRPYHEPYFVWIGRLDPRKNLERILLAWKELSDTLKSSARLILIGHWDPAEVKAFDPRVASLLEQDGIVTLSRISEEEHRQLLTHAHGLVFPSIAEGFGLPAIEAMKCGAPVLTSNTTSLPEVVGEAAMLVDPTSVRQIREGMEELLTDASLRDELRRKGLRQAQRFTWESTARQTLDVYREVLG